MKEKIIKVIKSVIFAGPFVILCLVTLLNLRGRIMALIPFLIFLSFAIYFIRRIWINKSIESNSLSRKILRGILAIFCYFVWFILLFSIFVVDYAFDVRCTVCDKGQIKPIISENGIILDLNKGKEIKKYDKDGWQTCGCRKVVSFGENSDYILAQIKKMDNYWIKYDNCQNFLNNYKTYAKQVDFSSNGSCYAHSHYETINGVETDIVIVFDEQTKQLFYHYYRP